MANSALRNALIARASEGTSTAGVPPNGLSPPTLALRTYSGRALVNCAQPRNAIDATPSAIIARVLKHIIAKTNSRESFSIGARYWIVHAQGPALSPGAAALAYLPTL